eukprot:gene13377-19225_t
MELEGVAPIAASEGALVASAPIEGTHVNDEVSSPDAADIGGVVADATGGEDAPVGGEDASGSLEPRTDAADAADAGPTGDDVTGAGDEGANDDADLAGPPPQWVAEPQEPQDPNEGGPPLEPEKAQEPQDPNQPDQDRGHAETISGSGMEGGDEDPALHLDESNAERKEEDEDYRQSVTGKTPRVDINGEANGTQSAPATPSGRYSSSTMRCRQAAVPRKQMDIHSWAHRLLEEQKETDPPPSAAIHRSVAANMRRSARLPQSTVNSLTPVSFVVKATFPGYAPRPKDWKETWSTLSPREVGMLLLLFDGGPPCGGQGTKMAGADTQHEREQSATMRREEEQFSTGFFALRKDKRLTAKQRVKEKEASEARQEQEALKRAQSLATAQALYVQTILKQEEHVTMKEAHKTQLPFFLSLSQKRTGAEADIAGPSEGDISPGTDDADLAGPPPQWVAEPQEPQDPNEGGPPLEPEKAQEPQDPNQPDQDRGHAETISGSGMEGGDEDSALHLDEIMLKRRQRREDHRKV